jgi:hypothetical protein
MLKNLNIFRRPTLQEVRARTITDLELSLHEAKLTEDRAKATTFMLQTALNRLKAEQNANT